MTKDESVRPSIVVVIESLISKSCAVFFNYYYLSVEYLHIPFKFVTY